jgi:putative PIN family toxin of toxin-antitoxin system
MRVVIDTSVFIAGLRSRQGASYRILSVLPDRVFTPLLSVPLLLEYESVLTRPEHLVASGLSREEAEAVLDVWAALSSHVRLHYLWRPRLRDRDDDMVLETAVNGRADAIVTHNVNDFSAAAQYFQVGIWTPAALLQQLRQP